MKVRRTACYHAKVWSEEENSSAVNRVLVVLKDYLSDDAVEYLERELCSWLWLRRRESSSL